MHLFYQPDTRILELDEEESRHCTKVLRLSTGDMIHVTNGKGLLQKCRLHVGKRSVTYEAVESTVIPKRPYEVHMAVAPTRKAERNEWMVEKMTEMGVECIDFIVTTHTHKETVSRVVNLSRLNRIAASAMKQSQQYYMPEISIITDYESFIKENQDDTRLIAYVPDNHLTPHVVKKIIKNVKTTLLIGPEGDFSPEEVILATANGFEAVSLGATRLRTETAAAAGCHAINLAQLI
jgi:16S rRNA (uracil1498-N3)-methyltransferase